MRRLSPSWGFFQTFQFINSPSPLSWERVQQPTCMCVSLMTSKALALGFLTMQKLVVFALVLQRVRGQLAFVPKSLVCAEAGLGQVCSLQTAQVLGTKGLSLRFRLEYLGEQLLGPEGSGETPGGPRGLSSNQPEAGTFGNILEMTPGDTRHTCSMAWERCKRLHCDGDIFC